jgi:hypothetical protein
MTDRIRSKLCAPRSSASTSWCHENCVEQLLLLRVPYLSILEDLADKVHWLLLDFHRGLGGTSVGMDLRYCLSSMKAAAT